MAAKSHHHHEEDGDDDDKDDHDNDAENSNSEFLPGIGDGVLGSTPPGDSLGGVGG